MSSSTRGSKLRQTTQTYVYLMKFSLRRRPVAAQLCRRDFLAFRRLGLVMVHPLALTGQAGKPKWAAFWGTLPTISGGRRLYRSRHPSSPAITMLSSRESRPNWTRVSSKNRAPSRAHPDPIPRAKDFSESRLAARSCREYRNSAVGGIYRTKDKSEATIQAWPPLCRGHLGGVCGKDRVGQPGIWIIGARVDLEGILIYSRIMYNYVIGAQTLKRRHGPSSPVVE